MIKVMRLAVAALLAGCQTYDLPPAHPARLVDRTTMAQQELREVLSARLPGNTVIADDIFSASSVALFEVGFSAHPLNSQALMPPLRVQLLRREQTCLLRFNPQEEVALEQVHCVAVKR